METQTTSGFYRVDDYGYFAYAPNFVNGPGYDLYIEDKDTYSYPIEGWTWFASEDAARIFFGLPPREIESTTTSE